MDRREALKKLGVGGAVAVGAPVLFDSFRVASAASNCVRGQDIPAGSLDVKPSGVVSAGATVTVTGFPAGASISATEQDNVGSVNISGGTATFVVINGGYYRVAFNVSNPTGGWCPVDGWQGSTYRFPVTSANGSEKPHRV